MAHKAPVQQPPGYLTPPTTTSHCVSVSHRSLAVRKAALEVMLLVDPAAWKTADAGDKSDADQPDIAIAGEDAILFHDVSAAKVRQNEGGELV